MAFRITYVLGYRFENLYKQILTEYIFHFEAQKLEKTKLF